MIVSIGADGIGWAGHGSHATRVNRLRRAVAVAIVSFGKAPSRVIRRARGNGARQPVKRIIGVGSASSIVHSVRDAGNLAVVASCQAVGQVQTKLSGSIVRANVHTVGGGIVEAGQLEAIR